MRPRLMGTEIEYGIFIDGVETSGLDAESAALVRAYRGPCAKAWDYSQEDPRRDMRGFSVDQLARDPADAKLDQPGDGRRADGTTVADRILANGARLYNDHAHPEYSTPECSSVRELIAHEKAGERIVLECARARAEALGVAPVLYKNNTDFDGISYGSHENYLTARAVPTDDLVHGLMAFLVTRQIYAGAGKVGVERHRAKGVEFQLSQRADFADVQASVDTLARRPIVNMRDEPHADPARFRRLHVICGDANMNEYAMALKLGTTALTLETIEQGLAPTIRLARPVEAIRQVSWDLGLAAPLELADGGTATAIEIQRRYLAAAADADHADDQEAEWLLAEWAGTLDALAADPIALADRIDWVAKFDLLAGLIQGEGLTWQDDMMRSVDLAYHDIDPENGLFYGLQAEGRTQRVVTEEEIVSATTRPPQGTRAAVRGACVARFGDLARSVRWGRISLETLGETYVLDLERLIDGGVGAALAAIEGASGVEDLAAALTARTGD